MLEHIGIGLIAGAAATVVMDASQRTVIPAVASWIEERLGRQSPADAEPDGSGEPAEGTPARLVRRLADYIDVELTHERAMELGNRLHWAYGTLWGLPFALMPIRHGPLSGAGYGAFLWLASDELLLWAIGVAAKPTDYPLSTHLQALAAHAVYGASLGTTALGLEAALRTRHAA